ncbi:MAG: phosphotransferase [Rhodocyclaceae bacterium]|nr:phosphotransferase [Rhodocyclaceae bacterium]
MQRLELLQQWLHGLFPGRDFTLAPASADASFRRYFRVSFPADESLIVMDAPPEREDCRPYLHVAELFWQAGTHVPAVLEKNLDQGFLLLSDLGSTTYLAALRPENARRLYGDATAALVKIQLASRPGELPEYDRALLQRELDLFPDWYLTRHLGLSLTDSQRNVLKAAFDHILAVNLAEPRVFVHRDYHSRNLMLLPDAANPGVLDFQDAVYGPISYDLVSLFKDAYVEWEEEETLDWLIRYWEQARKAGLPVNPDFALFHRDYEFMGAQRHIKVLGIFARLYHRDGKDGYLKDMPLVMHYLRKICDRYRALGPLLKLLDDIEGKRVEVGYTF